MHSVTLLDLVENYLVRHYLVAYALCQEHLTGCFLL